MARILELQIIGLGEDPANNLPIFTCIAEKHRSGLHIDTGGNPATSEDLIHTPELLAKKQKEMDYPPNSLANTLRKTISLQQSTPDLFNAYQKCMEEFLDETPPKLPAETFRKNHAKQLLQVRLQDYEKAWNQPFQESIVDIKKHYTELLNHLMSDLSLYFGIMEGNTLDIIEKLVEKEIFTEESGELLKEAVAAVYVARVGLHFAYGQQKETALEIKDSPPILAEKVQNQLEKAYWLVLRSLYRKLKEAQFDLEFHFQQLDLIKCAIYEEVLDPEGVENLKPLIVHCVHHFVSTRFAIPSKELEVLPYYNVLSNMNFTEPLRETYLKTLEVYANNEGVLQLIHYFASLSNPSGVRQAHRLENERLQAAILAMTTDDPDPSILARIRSPTLPNGRYLREKS